MEDARLIVHVSARKIKVESGARQARELLAAHGGGGGGDSGDEIGPWVYP